MYLSEFQLPCHDGDVLKVEQLLPHLTRDDIDHFEANGSTALHAASYYGHAEIVRLLLEIGASRTQTNQYNLTPADEAKTLEIAKLFNRDKICPNCCFVANVVNRE